MHCLVSRVFFFNTHFFAVGPSRPYAARSAPSHPFAIPAFSTYLCRIPDWSPNVSHQSYSASYPMLQTVTITSPTTLLTCMHESNEAARRSKHNKLPVSNEAQRVGKSSSSVQSQSQSRRTHPALACETENPEMPFLARASGWDARSGLAAIWRPLNFPCFVRTTRAIAGLAQRMKPAAVKYDGQDAADSVC